VIAPQWSAMTGRVACTLVVMAALVASSARTGEAPEIVVKLSTAELYVGESADYHVSIKNITNPVVPDLTAFSADFDYRLMTEQPRTEISTTIINGRMSKESSFTYVYRLTPKRSGTLVIPAPKVNADGVMISGRPVQMRVQAIEKQDLCIAEIRVSRPRVYPTQPFEVTLKILIKPLPTEAARDPLAPLQRQNPAIEINWADAPAGLSANEKGEWLNKFITHTGVGFTLNALTVNAFEYAVFSLQTGREIRSGMDGGKISYFVYELKRTFTPEKAGSHRFGPASIKGHFVDSVSGQRFNAKRLVVSSDPLTVDVADVPEPRPATFCGGVGSYDISAAATPATLRVGDPLTMTLEVRRKPGSGSLDLVKAPDLLANEKLAADFDVIDKAPTGETKGDVKRFSYALRPKRVTTELPAIALTFFDPEAEKFSQSATLPIALTVTQAAQLRSGELVGALPSTTSQEIKSRQEGIFQNVTDVGELKNQKIKVSFAIGSAIGAWLLMGVMGLYVANWRRRSIDAAWQRRQRARRHAEENVSTAREAARTGKKSDALKAVRAALVGLIADMVNGASAGMTAHEAGQILSERGISNERSTETVKLLETIEANDYGSVDAQNLSTLIDAAAVIIPNLYRELDVAK